MSTLDKVMEMQKNGMSDPQITTQLKNEGVSPTEINDSLNQAKIKNAVSQPEEPEEADQMQSSIMPNPNTQQPTAQTPAQNPQQPITQEMPQAPSPEIYPPQYQNQGQEQYYQETPQAYSQQDYYAPQGGMDTETISEIAEQVANEKLNEYKNKVGDIGSFQNTIQDKVNDIDDRLRRIESTIDKLQQAIVGKIGEFGENSAMIHKDLDNLHGTVSKLMDPLIDNINEMKKIANK
jgi:hypothetical protein